MPILRLSPALLYLTLVPMLEVLMPASVHPQLTPCTLTQRTALCDNCNLLSVPRDLPENIEELILNLNLIQKLQDGCLSSYPLLRTLSCANNHLETVESKVFHNTPHLENLNLADNNLHTGHEQIGQSLRLLSKLRTLDLSGNRLTEDMAFVLLQNLTSLESLSLSRNRLSRLDEATLSDLHQLRELNLEGNVLFEIDGAFDHLQKLQRLNLAFNYLPCLVKFEMTQLVVLNASHNAIEWFISNQDLKETFQLETLDLSDNKLLFFPFLPTHNCIRTLLLSQNRISFYEHLADITSPNWATNVLFYNLKGNVSNITAELWDESLHGDISTLELLDLSRNQVTYFPQGFIHKMPHLYRLRLRTNCLESLNLTSGELAVTLYELDVSNNRLTELHSDESSVSELNNLTYLNLSLNYIQRLPPRLFANLPSLSTVDLSYNTVGICARGEDDSASSSDCAVWANMASLRQLYLAECNLVQLPATAFDGTSLTLLELSNNPDLLIDQDSFAGLSETLQHLGLGNTGIRDFDFSPFRHLRSLNISKNSIAKLPDSFLSLDLRLLDLRENKLTTISSEQANVLAQTLRTVFINGNAFNCCHLNWYRTFEKTHIISDISEVTCLDLENRKHRVEEVIDILLCGFSDEESILWYILLFLSVGLSLVGISVIYLLTFKPRLLPKAIKKRWPFWRPSY